MPFKKEIAVLICFVMAVALIMPASGLAQGSGVSLEEAIKIAKSTIEIPESFRDFTSSYNEYRDRASWHLNWREPENRGGNISVTIDAKNGDIIHMYVSEPFDPQKKYSAIPKYSRDEAVSLAEAFIKKIAPDKINEIKLMEDIDGPYHPMPVYYGRRGPIRYSFRFQRMVKGIPFPDNGIYVTVNGDTGKTTNFNMNWDDVDFPDAQKAINAEEALKKYKENNNIRLMYQKVYPDYAERDKPPKILLVYQPPRANFMIDAITGEPIENAPYYGFQYAKGEAMALERKAKQDIKLTPEEKEEVEQTSEVMSKEEATKKAQEYIKVPKDYKLMDANLNQNWEYPKERRWSFSWRKEGKEYGYINISINAVDGELLSFYRHNSSMNNSDKDFKAKYDREEAEKIAREFIEKLQPEKAQMIELMPFNEDEYLDEEKVRQHHFNFNRVFNGVLFIGNGFNLSVDSATGEVVSYSMNWGEYEFPDAQVAMEQVDAENAFFGKLGIELTYARIYQPYDLKKEESEPEIKLAYRLKPSPSYRMDAVTGKLLDHKGEPIKDKKRLPFTDIDGHEEEDDIKLLFEMGIVGGENDKFRPDDVVTNAEFLKMLDLANGLSFNPEPVKIEGLDVGKWYYGYYSAALQSGIIENDNIPEPNGEVKRINASKMFINGLGYGSIAEIPGIYSPPVKDAASIPEGFEGYVSLAVGLKIIKPIEGSFSPDKTITRAEAASMIVNYLKVER